MKDDPAGRAPDEDIRKMFGYRCVRCGEPNCRTIHEIIPRSLRPKDWFVLDNRVVLCGACHDHIHRLGAVNFVSELEACRERALGLNGTVSYQ